MASETTTIVILGASGDLAQRKLVPALFNLGCKGRIPENLRIVGFSRSPHSDDQFRERMWQGVQEIGELAVRQDEWAVFAQSLFYVAGDLGSTEDMVRLKDRLGEMENGASPANRLFYLSITPQLYETAIKNLGDSGLSQEETGWRRVVIEKPFGRDPASAQALNGVAHQVFDEGQIFRIDHYLGKEMVQNLMVFRFANAIFEPLWNRNYVDNVRKNPWNPGWDLRTSVSFPFHAMKSPSLPSTTIPS
jgi:glucose-6-phosphate 1-dehydrogenase